ncbi:MAG: glycosyl transferase group 1 [Ferruginibacter sp.]|uniref:glycosyltransferase n=1 Tax=Ferruginibacter sp. TaxID=1940288 RepID=UPI00265B7031|nr:glycosyltransferase [Ferruginibacter sp.]MDB5277766.1 glycosyl transferase group 1 [Ferruginibacter sp.]
MKILFVLGLEVNPKVGGVERVTHVLSHYFVKEGIQVGFLYFTLQELTYYESDDKIVNYFVPDTTQISTDVNITYVHDVIVSNDFNIIINQGNIANAVTLLISKAVEGTSCKIISILHNTPLIFTQFYGQYRQTLSQYLQLQNKSIKNSIKKRLLIFMAFSEYQKTYKRYVRLAIQSSERFVLLSKGYVPLLNKISGIKDNQKIIAIPNPLSYNDHYAVAEISKKKNQVIYVGRLEFNQKRLDRLLNVWKMVEMDFTDWQLIIVGGSLHGEQSDNSDYQNMELQRLKQLAKHLKLNKVIFAGNQDPVTFYKESSIFCLTSSYEGFPMVLIEAVQYGVVPIVFGSFEAIYDLIDNNINGSIVTPFDLNEFGVKLKEQMGDKQKREKMAAEALLTSKRYTIDVIGQEWIQTFKNVIAGQ